MKKLILSTLYITIISFGFSQDFKINSSESIVEFNYLSEEAVGTIKGVSGTIHFDINNLSEHNFVAPYRFIGAAALSVDKAITTLTLFDSAASTMF